MLHNFSELLTTVKALPKATICIANADSETVEAARMALSEGLADAILFGDEAVINPLVEEAGLCGKVICRHTADPAKALSSAVAAVRCGEAQVLMKGMLNSSDFLRGVLHKTEGLRSGRRLSHVAAVELPGHPRLIYSTDGGMNINPDLAGKKDIVTNTLLALHKWGYECPNVACLAANERVEPANQATTDAAGLVAAWQAKEFPMPCVVEGPMAMDVALNPESARHKGIDSRISGQVDVFLMPTMEVGNVAIKGLLHFLPGSQVAGLILGASAPVVMTSRSEPPASKLHATALACLAAR